MLGNIIPLKREEFCEFAIDFFRELLLFFGLLLAFLLFGFLVAVNHTISDDLTNII